MIPSPIFASCCGSLKWRRIVSERRTTHLNLGVGRPFSSGGGGLLSCSPVTPYSFHSQRKQGPSITRHQTPKKRPLTRLHRLPPSSERPFPSLLLSLSLRGLSRQFLLGMLKAAGNAVDCRSTLFRRTGGLPAFPILRSSFYDSSSQSEPVSPAVVLDRDVICDVCQMMAWRQISRRLSNRPSAKI